VEKQTRKCIFDVASARGSPFGFRCAAAARLDEEDKRWSAGPTGSVAAIHDGVTRTEAVVAVQCTRFHGLLDGK
jgi:hypothetical protein